VVVFVIVIAVVNMVVVVARDGTTTRRGGGRKRTPCARRSMVGFLDHVEHLVHLFPTCSSKNVVRHDLDSVDLIIGLVPVGGGTPMA
jgi:hypothetical protein